MKESIRTVLSDGEKSYGADSLGNKQKDPSWTRLSFVSPSVAYQKSDLAAFVMCLLNTSFSHIQLE